MKIESISIESQGYVYCKSSFYTALDIIDDKSPFHFSIGINKLSNEIDSGIWAVSYLLSMSQYRPKDFILFEKPQIEVNNSSCSLAVVSEYSCYMDNLNPLFDSKTNIRKLVVQGLQKSSLKCEADDIKNIFCIHDEHFERPLTGTGNEVFKAMAAIGYANGKRIFCFPWLSKRRFDGYHRQILGLLDILNNLRTVVILPVGS